MRSVNVALPRARRVLDFGCGVGWVLAEAHVEGNPLRFGVDYSVAALRGTIGGPQLTPGAERPAINFAVGDGVNLPFADHSFDVIVGHVSMPYMDTGAAFREIYRVLAPGGSIFLTFHSFEFVRQWFFRGLRQGSVKQMIRCAYIAINGVRNHFSLPQTDAWWKRGDFETFNTAHGVFRSASREGFVMISTEHTVRRIFFAMTARKPDPVTGTVLPAPGWTTYCELADATKADA